MTTQMKFTTCAKSHLEENCKTLNDIKKDISDILPALSEISHFFLFTSKLFNRYFFARNDKFEFGSLSKYRTDKQHTIH